MSTQVDDPPQDKVEFYFDDKLTFENLENGIESLISPDLKKCGLVGTKIKLGKKLGQGGYGAVFEILFPLDDGGMEKSKFVVKNLI